jgi:hypothetical protein
MLFQNSCVVPFGMTAIVSFFFAVVGAAEFVHPIATNASKMIKKILFILFSSF